MILGALFTSEKMLHCLFAYLIFQHIVAGKLIISAFSVICLKGVYSEIKR